MSLSRRNKLKRCAGRNLPTENGINELPDDILIYILSFLTLKEAGRTRILSKRWKHVCGWTYITTLNFEGRGIINEVKLGTKSLEIEEPKYFSWIDQVLSSHKAPTIDEFRVQFDIDFNNTIRNRIDNWLHFAIQKRVKSLEISFHLYKGINRPLRYTFPSFYCNSLTSLELGCVNITGEFLESVLCSCLALEYLSVKHSETLVELKVDGPTLNLKSLTIYRCYNIKQLEISAPNLVSICYFGPKINVQFKCTPKLAQVSIGYDYAVDLIHSFSDLSSYLSQIEVLELTPSCRISLSCPDNVIFFLSLVYICRLGVRDGDSLNLRLYIYNCCLLFSQRMRVSNDLVFSRLKKLDLIFMCHSYYSDDDILFLMSLLKACPFLHHLKLQCSFWEQESMGRKKLVKPEAFWHYHLKIVEIVGFVGYRLDTAIVEFLIANVVSLDKIIIDPRHILLIGSPWEFELTMENRRARMRAKKFLTNLNLKPATKLEIL